MRRFAALLPLVSAVLAAQTASLSGVTTNADTHEPLAGVHVRLLYVSNLVQDSENQIARAMPEVYGTVSDREGRFQFASLKAGVYMAMPDARGFLEAPHKDNAIRLKAGEHRTDLTIEMQARGVIAGRVMDEFGDPVQNVSITVEIAGGAAGRQSGWFNGSLRPTDDRGMFRLIVAPGKYYVKANPPRMHGSGPPEIRTDGTPTADYGPTYFPSAAAKGSAAVVEIRPGAERPDVEIRLSRTALRTLSIHGTVIGLAQGRQAEVHYETGPSPTQIRMSSGEFIAQDGKFTIANLEPGFYRIWAQTHDGDGPGLQSAAVELKLDRADPGDIELRLTSGMEVTGTLEYSGEQETKSVEKVAMRLMPIGSYGSLALTTVDRKGVFQLSNARPGKYRVEVVSLPEDAFIQTVELDGARVEDEILELKSAPAAKLRIVVNRQGAQVSGTVHDANGEPLTAAMAMVMLVDDVKRLDRMRNGNPSFVKFASPDGKFVFRALRPGKYHLVALDLFDAPDRDDDLAWLKEAVSTAPEVEVEAGARIVKNVNVTPPKESDGKKK